MVGKRRLELLTSTVSITARDPPKPLEISVRRGFDGLKNESKRSASRVMA